ncbi:Kinesin light chain 3 [Physocladia obscura]|uniref:Kinesin light chain 3 n=1 Tax=Physocladia obscura TaxID=109957 RepID=A0AAD5T6I3_9FUNG|nr:Kinesin light chain 3 [Physocladia obscura]
MNFLEKAVTVLLNRPQQQQQKQQQQQQQQQTRPEQQLQSGQRQTQQTNANSTPRIPASTKDAATRSINIAWLDYPMESGISAQLLSWQIFKNYRFFKLNLEKAETSTGKSQWEKPEYTPPPPPPDFSPLPIPNDFNNSTIESTRFLGKLHNESKFMSTTGVRLSYINHLVEFWTVDRLQGKTTTDICKEVVVPWTQHHKSSVCDLLAKSDNPKQAEVVAEASWFISHAWKYQFLDVVSTLNLFFSNRKDVGLMDKNEDPVVWFDLFTNSQHNTSERPFEWWQTTFMEAVQKIRNVVMVCIPWEDPVTLRRAWCAFEVFATKKTGSTFHVAMTGADMQRFKDKPYFAHTSKISIKNSEAFKASDRENIFRVIIEELGVNGVARVDSIVKDMFFGWIIQNFHMIAKSIPTYADTEGGLLMLTGDSTAAVAAFENFYTWCKVHNEETMHTAVVGNLGLAYAHNNELERAVTLFSDYVNKMESLLGPISIQSGRVLDDWGISYLLCHDYDKAESILNKAYAIQLEFHSFKAHRAVLVKHHLVMLYIMKEEFDKAFSVVKEIEQLENQFNSSLLISLEDVLAVGVKKIPYTPVATITKDIFPTQLEIQTATFYQGNYDAPLIIFQKVLSAILTVSGHSVLTFHISTLTGLCHLFLGQNKAALEVLEEALDKSIAAQHCDILVATAMAYHKVGQVEEALLLLKLCITAPTRHFSHLKLIVWMKLTIWRVYRDLDMNEEEAVAYLDLQEIASERYGIDWMARKEFKEW